MAVEVEVGLASEEIQEPLVQVQVLERVAMVVDQTLTMLLQPTDMAQVVVVQVK
jgi:hypothetical protein